MEYLSPASLPAGSDDLLEVPGSDRLQGATHRHDLRVLGTVALLKEETYNVNGSFPLKLQDYQYTQYFL